MGISDTKDRYDLAKRRMNLQRDKEIWDLCNMVKDELEAEGFPSEIVLKNEQPKLECTLDAYDQLLFEQRKKEITKELLELGQDVMRKRIKDAAQGRVPS